MQFQTFKTRIAFKAQYYSKKLLFRFARRLPHFKKAHVNTFPAVHFKKLDWVDLSFKFSSELLVVGVALLFGLLNIFFFSGHKIFADDSHTSKLLSYHTEYNPKLYAKLTSINTVVIAKNGFFTQANADDFAGLSPNQTAGNEQDQNQNTLITDGVITKPNLSTQDLMAKQIKIYETKPGDTLKSIAKQNDISQQTIIWANNLPGNSIKPGWQLIILPTDGVVVKANSNTTLPDLAQKYKGSLETIISYNGLASAEDIQEGQLIVVPGGSIAPPPAPTKVAPKNVKKPEKNIAAAEPIDNVISVDDSSNEAHLFPKGYCTWYVAQKVRVPWGGNAKAWLTNAKAYGKKTGNQPASGTIVVTTDSARYGHVAYVEKVTEDTIIVSEMNYTGFGKVDWREIPKDSPILRGYIYP